MSAMLPHLQTKFARSGSVLCAKAGMAWPATQCLLAMLCYIVHKCARPASTLEPTAMRLDGLHEWCL